MDSIYQSIEILSKEKGIDTQIVLDAVKDAMLIAARKHFRTTENYDAVFDENSGGLKLFSVKTVAETVADPALEVTLSEGKRIDPAAEIGSVIRIQRPTDALGRISAQTAKQVIFQKVREAERETIYREYSDRVGELVNTSIKRVEGLDLVVDLGKTEARLPKREQSRLESYSVGDRVRCVIRIVDKSSKGPGVVVSRADSELVKRLFEQEVPEIYDGTVSIRGCAREAGERTKIAVSSRDRDVDSVGACVGMKGMRVQSIIRELRGEKIDIIEYSEDPVQFATHALSPAKISRVTVLDPVERHMEVIVDDSQLSLAIGKKGQNVRLAAKLLGWKIDIKSEEEKRQEVQNAINQLSTGAPVSVLIEYGLGEATVDALVKGSIGTVEKLGGMTPEQLEAIEGIDGEAVNRIQQAINGYYGQEYGEQQAAETGQGEGGDAAQESAAEAAVAPAPDGDSENAEVSASDTMVESPEQVGEAVPDHVPAPESELKS
ncbi:MAG: transcription termination factor NusA [Acidobacteriota bacterium]|nr:transcription termination factor NusA [Acidobacteriota bacterium]